MKKISNWLIVVLILVIIGAVMTVTCPDTQAHKDKLSQMVGTSVKKAISGDSSSDDLLVQGLQMVGGIVINKVVDGAVDDMLQVENYVVCSIGRINYQAEDHIVSLGLLGHIFTVNQDKLDDAVKKYYQTLQEKTIGNVGEKVRETIEPYANKVVESIAGEVGNIIRDVLSGSEPEEDGQNNH